MTQPSGLTIQTKLVWGFGFIPIDIASGLGSIATPAECYEIFLDKEGLERAATFYNKNGQDDLVKRQVANRVNALLGALFVTAETKYFDYAEQLHGRYLSESNELPPYKKVEVIFSGSFNRDWLKVLMDCKTLWKRCAPFKNAVLKNDRSASKFFDSRILYSPKFIKRAVRIYFHLTNIVNIIKDWNEFIISDFGYIRHDVLAKLNASKVDHNDFEIFFDCSQLYKILNSDIPLSNTFLYQFRRRIEALLISRIYSGEERYLEKVRELLAFEAKDKGLIACIEECSKLSLKIEQFLKSNTEWQSEWLKIRDLLGDLNNPHEGKPFKLHILKEFQGIDPDFPLLNKFRFDTSLRKFELIMKLIKERRAWKKEKEEYLKLESGDCCLRDSVCLFHYKERSEANQEAEKTEEAKETLKNRLERVSSTQLMHVKKKIKHASASLSLQPVQPFSVSGDWMSPKHSSGSQRKSARGVSPLPGIITADFLSPKKPSGSKKTRARSNTKSSGSVKTKKEKGGQVQPEEIPILAKGEKNEKTKE